MAFKMTGFDVRVLDFAGNKEKISVFGEATVSDYDAIKDKINVASFAGLKVIGRNDRYINENANNLVVDPTGDKKMSSGKLLILRESAGVAYINGKFPADSGELNKILDNLLAGTKTLGGFAITGVDPQIKSHSRRTK